MALGSFSPAFADGPPDDLIEIQAREAEVVAAYPRPKNLRITDITIPGSQRQIPARLYQPIDESGNLLTGPLPIFVWFHGGAFIFGDINMGEAEFTACEVASQANAVTISVDYKLADADTRFPCSQVDGIDSVLWAREQASSLHADPEKLFVGGGSAGAFLAGSVSLMLRDRGVKAAGILPIYPAAHQIWPDMTPEIYEQVKDIFYFTPEFSALHNPWLLEGIENYDANEDKFHCFPGDTVDKSGQGRFLIVHAEKDSLRLSGELWTKQLRAAGVSVDEFIEPGQTHGYLSYGPTNPGTAHTLALMARWIKGS
jgi:acetyl esterase/lipase